MKIKILNTEFYQLPLSELKQITGLGLFHLVLIALCRIIFKMEATKVWEDNIAYWKKTRNNTIVAITTRLNNKPEPELAYEFYSIVAARIFGVDIHAYTPNEVATAQTSTPPIPKGSSQGKGDDISKSFL